MGAAAARAEAVDRQRYRGGEVAGVAGAAAAGGVVAMITIWLVSGKPDVAMAGNGVLAGLVMLGAPRPIAAAWPLLGGLMAINTARRP